MLINKKWPGVPVVPVLLSVQIVEILWVALNLLGIEQTTLGHPVLSLSDVHLAHMPYSHSIVTTAMLALAVWFFFSKGMHKPQWGIALAVGVFSHTLLDLLVHAHDIPIAPGIELPKLGSGLYDIPLVALGVETLYGVWCWHYFGGSKRLLATILVFNLGAISFYSAAIPGPEQFMSGQPKLFAAFIGFHITTGLAAVWYFARSAWR